MLLRNNSSNRGESDQDIYLNMASTQQQQEEHDEIIQITPTRRPIQSAYYTGHEEENSTTNQDFDDVWGDDDGQHQHATFERPPSTTIATIIAREGGQTSEVSDIPRLKQEHTTAGYRDGVTLAKAASVQAGFDEGYGLGASIGAYAGRLLGVLTGLVGAVTSSSASSSSSSFDTGGETGAHENENENENENGRLRGLLETATKELSVLSIFGEEYFARDGTWRYEVEAPSPSTGAEGKEGGEGPKQEEHIVFADIAAAHPLVKKWDGILEEEARRYGLVWEVLLPEEEGHGHDHEVDGKEDANKDGNGDDGGSGSSGKKPLPVRQSKGALAW